MKILFLTSPAPEKSPFSTREKRPPLGLGMLIALAEQNGHEVIFCDCYVSKDNFDPDKLFSENNIDVVAIYLNTICLEGGLDLVNKVDFYRRENKWNGIIVVGGPHTSVDVNNLPLCIDHIVIGEGEKSFFKIINGEIDDKIIIGEKIDDLDSLPYQPWRIFSKINYDKKVHWLNCENIFTLNTSRGCPFSCTFCSVKSIWGRSYRFQSASRVVSEIEYLIENYNADGIYFREDHFTLNKERLFEFCNIITRKNMKFIWACETRVDALTEDLIELMSQSGCRAVYLGIESGSQKILDFYKKGIEVGKALEIVKVLRRNGISVYGSFVVGVPQETILDLIKTYLFIIRSSLNSFSLNIFIGIPGSELYENILAAKSYEYKDILGLLYPVGFHVKTKYFYNKNSSEYVDYRFKKISFYDLFLICLIPVRSIYSRISKLIN